MTTAQSRATAAGGVAPASVSRAVVNPSTSASGWSTVRLTCALAAAPHATSASRHAGSTAPAAGSVPSSGAVVAARSVSAGSVPSAGAAPSSAPSPAPGDDGCCAREGHDVERPARDDGEAQPGDDGEDRGVGHGAHR